MAELGVAELLITADPTQALAAIRKVRAALENSSSDLGSGVFDAIVKDAPQAGAQAGKALRNSLQQSVTQGGALKLPDIKAPDLQGIKKALDLSKDLGATIAELRNYRKLLQDVQATTSATNPEFRRLSATIRETGAAIKTFETGTGDLVEALARVKNTAAGLTPEFSKTLGAISAVGSGLKATTNAALEAAKAIAGVTAKGAVETVKLPIFGLPESTSNIIDKARAQVERLQKQAETGSGKVARLTEGIFALGGAGAAAKGIVEALGGIGGTADSASSALAEVAQRLNTLPGAFRGLGGLGDFFSAGSESINQFVTSVLNAQGELAGLTGPLQAVTDSLAAIGPEAAAVGGVLAFTFAGFQDLIAKSFKPGVDGARAALKGMTDDTQRLLEALSRASAATKGLASLKDLQLARADATERASAVPVGTQENLQATQELVELNTRITEEKRRQARLEDELARAAQIRLQRETRQAEATTPARPPQQLLLPAFQERGLNPLDDSVRQGESFRRITEAIGSGWERGARYLEKSNQEMARLIEQGLKLRPLINSPVVTNAMLLPPGAPSASLPNSNQYQRPIGPVEDPLKLYARRQTQLADDIADVQAKRLVIQESIRRLEEATRRATARQDRQAGLLGQSSPIDGRLSNDRFIPGSPGFLKQRRDRRQEAASNALIGGAFPLLFGQGLGASIGGGLGGGLGGLKGGQFGFGASLIGTAVGAQFDAFVKNASALGRALEDPITKFRELAEAGLISTRASERQIESLIQLGRESEAAALIQKDLIQQYGSLKGAQELARQTQELGRAWAQLGAGLAVFAAGPLAAILNQINRALGGSPNGELNVFAFNGRLRDISKDNNPDAARGIRRRTAEIFASQSNPLQKLLGDLSFGTLGKTSSQQWGEAAAQAVKEAEARGVATKEIKAANAALAQARAIREKTYSVSLQQIDADAKGNKTLSSSLQLDKIQLDLRNRIATLKGQDKLFTRTGANSFELSPEVRQAQQDAETQRRQVLAVSTAAAEQSARELAAAKQLVGLEGERLTIRKEQQRVDEAQRQFAEADSAFRSRFGSVDPTSLVGAEKEAYQTLYNQRAIYENNLADIRLSAYPNIEAAERKLAQQRQQVQTDIAIAQRGNTITDTGRNAIRQAEELKRQIEDAQRLRDEAISRPGNLDLAKQADDAGQTLLQAGLTLRNSLEDAAKNAALTVQSITRSIEDAKTALAAARGGTEGVNKYIQPQQAIQRQQEANGQLFATANKLAEQLGVVATFSGTLAERNQQMVEFIQSARNELRSQQDIGTQEGQLIQAQADLKAVNESLVSVNSRIAEAIGPLATQMANLVNKDWSVNVTVDRNGGVNSGGSLKYNPTF